MSPYCVLAIGKGERKGLWTSEDHKEISVPREQMY